MIKLFWFLRNKWLYRNCPHLCCFCKYRKEHFNECYNEIYMQKDLPYKFLKYFFANYAISKYIEEKNNDEH